MALDPVKNFAKVTVSTTYDASATSIVLTADDGAKLPTTDDGDFNLVWWNSTDYPDPSDDPNKEIVRCTARSTDTLTVTRGQESIAASTKNTADKVYKMILAPTAKMITDIAAIKPSDLAITSQSRGDILRFDGTNWVRLAKGTSGHFLTIGADDPAWEAVAVADASVTQAKLKTTSGEVSYSSASLAGWSYSSATLPGGVYGFVPQMKEVLTLTGNWGDNQYAWARAIVHSGQSYIVSPGGMSVGSYTNGYVTRIELGINSPNNNSGVYAKSYAQQTYVTTSGKDHWIFLLVAKTDLYNEKGDRTHKKGDVISSYQAPDHPSANQGSATELDIPHPFCDYNSNKHEIVVVHNDILLIARQRRTRRNSLLQIIDEDFIIDDTKRPAYEPREIVKINEFPDDPIGIVKSRIRTPQWAKIMIGAEEITLEQIMVEQLPNNILFKKMALKDK